MKMSPGKIIVVMALSLGFALSSCSGTSESAVVAIDFESVYPNFFTTFSSVLSFNSLPDYESQTIPSYINLDNSGSNVIINEVTLLGRVLFYDKSLSSDNTVSCSSCHQQENAFSDVADVSVGVNGATGRHSMRLINSRFSREVKFFWDERAASLEAQTTQPIQDHNEMGFSGTNGDGDLVDLITKLEGILYYPEVFMYAFGNDEITESKIQLALSQFIRSIQSFDSKYDQGRESVANDQQNFSNFTVDENAGKSLFLTPTPQGGAGCAGCHSPPAFDIDPDSRSNGVVGVFGEVSTDFIVTRSPTLRDLFNPDGSTNGNFMHDASFATIEEVIDHYDSGITNTTNLDNRLLPGGVPQNLGLTATEKNQIADFLRTLTGSDVYNNSNWSTPFPN